MLCSSVGNPLGDYSHIAVAQAADYSDQNIVYIDEQNVYVNVNIMHISHYVNSSIMVK